MSAGRYLVGVSGSVLCALSLAACSDVARSEVSASARTRIVGGEPTASCAWATAVRYASDVEAGVLQCTATLIHPKLISIAAHCLAYAGKNPRIVFGDTDAEADADV